MMQIHITEEVQASYIETLKQILFTNNKKRKVSVSTKRFFNLLKTHLGIQSYSQVKRLLMNDDIHSLVRQYGSRPTIEEKYYDIYTAFRKEWAKNLVQMTNTKVCPYCNRNFIMNFDSNQTTVELDHYFPKADYPYLAINLYNLIPSCHTCNHKKGSKKLKIYPYKESINDYMKFSFTLNKLPFKEDNINLSIKIKNNLRTNRKKINNYENVLNISTLYENHKDIVSELLQKREIYSDDYINSLMNQYEGTLFKNKEDLLRLITCGYINDEDINKRPLSKLIKDISEELKLV